MNTHFLNTSLRKPQIGGTLIGVIMGLLVGLGVALAVAIYVTRVPVPFVNKVTPAASGDPVAEAKRNQNWDPNAPLYGKSPAVAASSAAPAATPALAASAPAAVAVAASAPKPATSAAVAVAVAASKPEVKPKEPKPAGAEPDEKDPTKIAKPTRESVDPLGSAIEKATAKAEQRNVKAGDPWIYFLQIGAFREQDAAEAQRGKLAMMGLEPKMNERDLNGRPMYRVRLGPYSSFDELQRAKEKVEGQGMEASTVRIPRDVPGTN